MVDFKREPFAGVDKLSALRARWRLHFRRRAGGALAAVLAAGIRDRARSRACGCLRPLRAGT